MHVTDLVQKHTFEMIAGIALIIVNGNVFTWEISKQDLGSKAGVDTTFCRLWQNQPSEDCLARGKVWTVQNTFFIRHTLLKSIVA